METHDAVAVVQAWLDAANQRESERLIDLSAADIAIVGPRGTGYGHQLLREWIERAGLELTTERVFVRGGAVVVAQRGVWRSLETGEVRGEQQVASRFVVKDGRVALIARYDSLDEALAAAGVGEGDGAGETG
jgi:hypothetical protein